VAGPPTLEKLALIDALIESTLDDAVVVNVFAQSLDHALGALSDIAGMVRHPEDRARQALGTIRGWLEDGIAGKPPIDDPGYDDLEIAEWVDGDLPLESVAIVMSEALELAVLALMDVSGDDPLRADRAVNKIEKVARRATARIRVLMSEDPSEPPEE